MRIVITGGTAGIGITATRRFSAEGNEVFGIARGGGRLAELEASTPGFKGVACDIADDASLAKLNDAVAEAARRGNGDGSARHSRIPSCAPALNLSC